jgi:hypothetical protein
LTKGLTTIQAKSKQRRQARDFTQRGMSAAEAGDAGTGGVKVSQRAGALA